MATIKFYETKGPYGVFSNFWRTPVRRYVFTDDKGRHWKTSEHYFQAMKFPEDSDRFHEIKDAPTPSIAAKLGRQRDVPIKQNWDDIRDDVMRVALEYKFLGTPFEHSAPIRKILIETGDARLVEHTYKDHYWADGGDGSGKNRLGELLMEVREKARALEKKLQKDPQPEDDSDEDSLPELV